MGGPLQVGNFSEQLWGDSHERHHQRVKLAVEDCDLFFEGFNSFGQASQRHLRCLGRFR